VLVGPAAGAVFSGPVGVGALVGSVGPLPVEVLPAEVLPAELLSVSVVAGWCAGCRPVGGEPSVPLPPASGGIAVPACGAGVAST